MSSKQRFSGLNGTRDRLFLRVLKGNYTKMPFLGNSIILQVYFH